MNKLSSVSFKSLYIIKPENNGAKYHKAINELEENKDVKIHKKTTNSGYGYYSHIVTDDKKDIEMETYFANNNINYKKVSTSLLLGENEIKSRMFVKIHDGIFQKNLSEPFEIDTDVIEKLFSKSFQYINEYDKLEPEEKLEYDKTLDTIKSGFPIQTPEIYFRKDEYGLDLIFQEGRFTFAVLRDLGLKNIPFAMGIKSYNIASEEGIV